MKLGRNCGKETLVWVVKYGIVPLLPSSQVSAVETPWFLCRAEAAVNCDHFIMGSCLNTRAGHEPSRRFHNHRDGQPTICCSWYNTLSSNQNKVDQRKSNSNGIFTLSHLQKMDPLNLVILEKAPTRIWFAKIQPACWFWSLRWWHNVNLPCLNACLT